MADWSYVSSDSAERMLGMVSAGFYDNSRIGQSLFQVIGAQWDEMKTWASELHEELFPQTCTWAVGLWEDLYGISPEESLSLGTRRQQIMARALYKAPINPETVRRGVVALTGCEEVVVEDFVAPYTFHVTVYHTVNLENMADVWGYIHSIKPSHLSFRLYFLQETPVFGDGAVAVTGGHGRVEERCFLEDVPELKASGSVAVGGGYGRVEERCFLEDVPELNASGSVAVAGGHGRVEERSLCEFTQEDYLLIQGKTNEKE